MAVRRIPEDVINDVRSKTDIVDVVSRYTSLAKRGRNYWCVCPFHDDHDPSLSVSTDKQIYKCFVCGAGGNVFTFVQEYDKVSFVDAVIKVASLINVDLSAYQALSIVPVDDKKRRLYEVMDEAQKLAEYQLYAVDGKKAYQRLKDRGYDHQLLRKFGVGVILGENNLINYLSAKGYSEAELIATDLARINERGLIDVFYHRIVFPIKDTYGRIVAFSARALDDDNKVKYINTAETVLYTKGALLYNYSSAKEEARRQDSLIICEGVTDCFAFSAAGYDHVVSLLGVACTDDQVRLIKQLSTSITLAFDGDKAGFEATYKIGRQLRNAHCRVSIWYNDSGLDPDDLLRQKGKEALIKGMEDQLHWLDFILSYAVFSYGLNSFENRKRVVEFVMPFLREEDELEQSYYLNKLADKTEFDSDTLKRQLSSLLKPSPPRKTVSKPAKIAVSVPEKTILRQMILAKEASHIYRDELGFLPTDTAQQLALVILDMYRKHDVISSADMLSLDLPDALRQFIIELEDNDVSQNYDIKIVKENIQLLQRKMTRTSVSQLNLKIKNNEDPDEQLALLNQVIALQRNKGGTNNDE